MVSYDAMHTFGGLIKDIFACLCGAKNLTGDSILKYEHNHNGYAKAHCHSDAVTECICCCTSTSVAMLTLTQPRCCR
jgi:hypothetical protein